MSTKVYIHERWDEAGCCPAAWAEFDTMAPHEMRHECERAPHPEDDLHVCSCGLVEIAP